MNDVVAWVASAATMIAAMMTAANLGTRVTGWGFVVFTLGSVAWSGVGLMTGQTSLAITNSFLLLVNLFGIWRWLGRQARHEAGSEAATRMSRQYAQVPSLYSGAALIGASLKDCNGASLGTVVDTMHDSGRRALAYVVIAQGGVGGAGETLRAIAPEHLVFGPRSVHCLLDSEQIGDFPPIDPSQWPAVAPPALTQPPAPTCPPAQHPKGLHYAQG